MLERGLRHRQDAERKEGPALVLRAVEAIERDIRARERAVISWLREKPWLAGRSLAAEVARCRRVHTESVARSRAQGAA